MKHKYINSYMESHTISHINLHTISNIKQIFLFYDFNYFPQFPVKHKTDKKKNIQIHAKNNELQNSNKSKSCTTISNNKTKLSKIIQQGGTTSKIIQDRNRQYQNSILSQQNDQITKEKINIQINGNTII